MFVHVSSPRWLCRLHYSLAGRSGQTSAVEDGTLLARRSASQARSSPITVGFECRDGEFCQTWQGTRPTLFTLSAPYGTWVEILRGRLGATKAITMRKLKVQGPFLQLLKGGDRVLLWVDILRTIPTEFDGEYAPYNISSS